MSQIVGAGGGEAQLFFKLNALNGEINNRTSPIVPWGCCIDLFSNSTLSTMKVVFFKENKYFLFFSSPNTT